MSCVGYNGLMTLTIIDTPHARASEEAAFAAAGEALERGLIPVVIVPTYDDTVRLKKEWASAGSFGIAVETLSAWIADLWELFGDGRSIVSPIQRQLLAGKALSIRSDGGNRDCGDSCGNDGDSSSADSASSLLAPTSGMRKFIASAAREALPYAVMKPNLGRGEREAVAVLETYRDLLATCGLVEESEAAFALAESGALAGYRPFLVGMAPDELTAVARKLVESADGVLFDNKRSAPCGEGRSFELERLIGTLYAPDEEHPVEATGAVRFVLPSGRYAVAGALADAIASALDDDPAARIVLAARDPHAMFEEVAPRLAARGVPSEVRGTLSFADTEFGAAWLALFDTVFGDAPLLARTASDFALSAYSGVGVRGAYWLDARWRANRAIDRDALLTDLGGTADHGLNGIVGSIECGRMDDAFDVLLAHLAKQSSWPEGYRDRQLAALNLARSTFEEAAALGADMREYRSILEDQRLFFSACTGSQPGAADGEANALGRMREAVNEPAPVLVVDLEGAAALGACSVDVLVIADLTAESYPVRDGEGVLSLLLEKLGASNAADGLASIRRTFFDAVSAPQRLLVLSRTLNTPAADEDRPAVVFEDVLDCYRTDLQDPSELDKKSGLPALLVPFASMRSEEGAYANLSAAGGSQAMAVEIPVMPTGFVTAHSRDKILLPQQRGGVVCEGYSLSPSAIESYLECPYKWFAHRRLRLEELDAGFGGREFGLFAHKVLEQFYARFRLDAASKVTSETLPFARELLARTFDERLAYEATLIGEPTALVPLNDLERKEVADLKRKLLGYLDREALLLPGYAPLDGEVSFGCNRGDFEYAGFKVNGTIDRVDVDGYGRAVVIDYKGAVGKAYALRDLKAEKDGASSSASFMLPRKVQTLIYAQAVRRTMGLEPVGALYLSYGKDEGIAGAFDHAALDPGKDLLDIDAAACGTTDFADMLDRVEEAVADRLQGLIAGEIPACPRDADACTYCPVTVCSVRDAVGLRSGGDE